MSDVFQTAKSASVDGAAIDGSPEKAFPRPARQPREAGAGHRTGADARVRGPRSGRELPSAAAAAVLRQTAELQQLPDRPLSANSRSASGMVWIRPAWRTTSVLPDGDLDELAVHVQADASAHPAPPFLELAEGAQAGKRHLRIRARSASGRVAGAAMPELGLTAHRAITGLPNLRLLPDAAVPNGRTVLLGSPATTSSRSVGAAASTAFHTSYQLHRVDDRDLP